MDREEAEDTPPTSEGQGSRSPDLGAGSRSPKAIKELKRLKAILDAIKDQKNITSDEGHSWKYRLPPRGLIAEDYTLYTANGRCPYADKCIEAHSPDELEEWRERFKFKRQQLQMAKDKHLHGNTYPEQLMEKLLTAEYPKSVMVASVDYAKVIVNSDLKVNMISKNISVGPKKTQKYQNLEPHCQEWKNPEITINRPGEYVYRVKVVFKTDIYGAFRQTLVFDFGSEPVLSRDMHVESAPVTDTEKVLTPDDDKSLELLKKYSLPEMSKFRFSEHLMQFNITTSLQLVNRFLLMPGSLSTAKFAQDGELFARMKLEDDLSVDSVAGRLILKSTNLVYEAVIEDRGKNFIFLRLSRECVEELELTCDQEFSVEVQFQLNRLHFCEMHHAVDALSTLDIVFPDTEILNKLPSVDDWKWKEDVGEKTNENQREAIMKCAAYSHMALPPLLIVGPFGTGKTYTLAQCAKHVLLEPETRILICTHSNSAADIYIKEFLHPSVEEGNEAARPLRVYYRHRWRQTVSHTVLLYCFFTHIFLDEAAQALECDMLIPLSLAGPKTRVVLAGDHMQMSPEAFSDFARQQQFHKSLLERLYDMYPDNSPCKVMLCENYRANRAIIEFTSELFYDNKLKASKDPIAHSIYEVIEQVEHLQKHWPADWGEFDENSICVVAPYSDQVMHIRSELRKRKMFKIAVERVVNVQGKQFRVIVMSTVRTRHTCSTDASATDKLDLGFLSNIKLLNTAITRAHKVWEYYLEVCNDNNSFFGMTGPHLRSLLNNVEMTKTYNLNPLAPEFIPKAVYPGQQGQPVFMAPHAAQVGWAGGTNAYRGLPQQMVYPSPYMPMPLYPGYAGFHPYYGPMVYRHPALYQQGLMGKGTGRGALGRQMGSHKPKVPAQQPNLPLQRDDDEKGESLRAEQTPPQGTPPKQIATTPVTTVTSMPGVLGTTPPKKGTSHKKYVAVPVNPRVPGMPMYPPYYGYPPYLMHPPEDPRLMPMGMPQAPYYYAYPPNVPRGHYPYMIPQPVQVQIPRQSGSGSLSPASSSDDRIRRTSGSSPTGSSHSDPLSVSPGSSASQQHAQHIQLLPNVVHVPSHLLYPTHNSANNSRSSTPVQSSSPGPPQVPVRDSPRNSQGEIEFPQRRHYSGPRPVSQSPSYSSQSSHESSASPTLNGEQSFTVAKTDTKTSSRISQRLVVKTESRSNTKASKPLTLNTNLNPQTTGFSQLFKDELGTPTEVANIVRMMDEEENVEDVNDEELSSRTADRLFRQEAMHQSKPSPPTGRLYLHLPVRPGPEDMPVQPPGTLPHQLPMHRDIHEMEFDPALLEPQTPMTPAGFHTPNIDLNTDPLEILRHLNINNDNLNRSTHGHF
ncbi:HELZ-like protein [Mya arenaria]|uniref:HELZ-like protein n=1 Tax=Mya arenaria TaxID=6604 RepID=A0ABY7DID1_MYAAR|nr:HELZ-like protein [Mya arenaria]